MTYPDGRHNKPAAMPRDVVEVMEVATKAKVVV